MRVVEQNGFITGGTGVVGGYLSKQCGLASPRLDVTSDEGWAEALRDREWVIHCAGIASSRGVSDEFVNAVNLDGTIRVAKQARDCGVKKFVFLSSVKVFGDSTEGGVAFSDNSPIKPLSAYGESKARAEDALRELHEDENFEVVIIRPTVVVSRGAKGAVGQMAKLAGKGGPFPVPAAGNMRDFVSIENLSDAIFHVLQHSPTGGQSYCVTDSQTISTADLFSEMADAYGKKARLVKLTKMPWFAMAKAVGKQELWERIFGNLQVDSRLIQEDLDWKPGISTLDFVKKEFI